MKVLILLRDTKDAVLGLISILLVYVLSALAVLMVLLAIGWTALIEILPRTKRSTSLRENFVQLKTLLQEWLARR